jgi:methionyl aminopeptidase
MRVEYNMRRGAASKDTGLFTNEAAAGISVKSPAELERIREAGQVVAKVIQLLGRSVEPGMKTRELDGLAFKEIKRLGAKPAFLGYRGYPATICVSLNHEVVHGIPSDRAIREGDLVKLDVGAIVDGFYGDGAATVGAGVITPQARQLVEVTRQSLEVGVQAARAGARTGDIGAAIQSFVEARGLSVVREYAGHGIGRALHEDPQVPNFGVPGRGPELPQGAVIAIEPMVNVGTWRTRVLDDHWTVVTADGSLSAHFEHTMIIGSNGAEVVTSPDGAVQED